MTTDFYPPPRPIPAGLVEADFLLEPLTPAHVEVDYEAVMSSRPMLRRWSGTDWPADEFTLEGNLEDLEMHDGEHRRREAFTYTVLATDRRSCLGCVYITPLSAQAEANPGLDPGPHDAVVSFWSTSSSAGQRIAGRLLASLRAWLDDAWEFDSISFAVRPELTEQVALLGEAGLDVFRRVMVVARGQEFLLFR